MLKLYGIMKKLTGFLVYVTYGILLAAMFFVTYSVILRYIVKKPLLGSVEIIEVAMSAMVFASLAWTQTEKGHIHITMLLHVLPRKLAFLLYAVCGVFSTAISGIAVYGLIQQGLYAISISFVTPMTAIPYAPFYFFAAVCMAILTLVLLLDTIIAFGALFNSEYAERVSNDIGLK